ncbi:MAG: ABC transporter permease subunit, partial [Candidatus Nanopelagicales bacterium]
GGTTAVQDWLKSVVEWADANRDSSPIFVYFFDYIGEFIAWAIDQVAWVISNLGWTGVTGVAVAVAMVFTNWKIAVLTGTGFIGFGVLGLWDDSMLTLGFIVVAVLLSLVIGIPLGIWAGISDRFNRWVTPVLDFMQIMPTFAYLPIIVLFFLIGPVAGTVATVIFAVPPAIRLTAAGVRDVDVTPVEASRSMGASKWQVLRQVQIPMAKPTIVVGVNQTAMAALAMVTIAALIATPGLGGVIIIALSKLDVGAAFDAGLAIVIMAIVFDRTTTAASVRSERASRSGHIRDRQRYAIWGSAAGVAILGVVIPGALPRLATFPEAWVHSTRNPVNSATDWVQLHLVDVTTEIKNLSSQFFVDPLQSLLTESPWFVVVIGVSLIAWMVSGRRAGVVAAICLVGCLLLGLWQSSMVTLAAVLIGALFTMLIGLLFGVWIGRSPWADRLLRPILDAGQTLPPFVYLIPAFGLFGPSRFTGILAGVVYASPVVIKIVGEGIRGVSATTTEAALASGTSRWQMITKVQLPMSRRFQLVAFNQGIVFLLSAVVIAGLAGAGGLGYDVIDGFSQYDRAGKGIAAGIAIVLLGIMLDRITQGAGRDRRGSAAGSHAV